MAETQKNRIMRVLGVDEAGANEILAYDKPLNRGRKPPTTLRQSRKERLASIDRLTASHLFPISQSASANLTPQKRESSQKSQIFWQKIAVLT